MINNPYKTWGVKKIVGFGLLMVVASGVGAIIFERLILPQLQTVPLLRDIGFLDTRSPLVITRREEIRIDGSVNTQEVISRVRGSLVKVYFSDGKMSVRESAPPLSGYIVASNGLVLFPGKGVRRGDGVIVVLENGQMFEGRAQFVDSASGIAFVKIEVRDLPVLNEAVSRDKRPGEQLLALSLLEGQGIRANATTLVRAIAIESSMSTTHDLTTFSETLDLEPNITDEDVGAVIVDKEGAVAGFVSFLKGRPTVLRVDDVRLVLNNFLAAGGLEVVWPKLRLGYLDLGPVEAELMGLPKRTGILVRQGTSGVATPHNLVAGDFVYEIDNREISSENSFQTVMLQKKAG